MRGYAGILIVSLLSGATGGLAAAVGSRGFGAGSVAPAAAVEPAAPEEAASLVQTSESRGRTLDTSGPAVAAVEYDGPFRPTESGRLYNRGLDAYVAGDLAGARELFEAALQADPANDAAQVAMRRVAMELR